MDNQRYTRIKQRLLKPKDVLAKLSSHPADVNSNIPNRPKTILHRLFWMIMRAAGISLSEWDALMKQYTLDPDNGIKQTPEDRTSARGNLSGQLLNPNMTWLSFFKGLKFLRFARFGIQFVGIRENGQVVRASFRSDLKPFDMGNKPDPLKDFGNDGDAP